MNPDGQQASASANQGDDAALALLMMVFNFAACIVAALCMALWLAGQLSGVLAGNGWPRSGPAQAFGIAFKFVQYPGHPAAAWPPAAAAAIGPSWLLYALLLVFGLLLAYAAYQAARFLLVFRRRREFRQFRLGFAHGKEIRRMLGAGAVAGKAKAVRPSLKDQRNIDPQQVGFYLGRDIRTRQKLYGSVEDVFIILAPPRQGKDVHYCAPYTIDAPGPCIVTSTRADAFTNTYGMRSRMGKVHVFDPNGLTNWPERLRWSPIKGAEDPIVAQNRAAAFVAGAGFELVGEGAYFVAASISILRLYLHAAALGRKTLRDILRWSTDPENMEPVELLEKFTDRGVAAPGWADEMRFLATSMDDIRDKRWAILQQTLTCFADPGVEDACSPGPFEVFDMEEFLSGRNTLYILGKEKKNGSVAAVATCLLEDFFDEIRNIASQQPGSRLDPPLTVELNEAAHIAPMPNLPGYMGDSGGFSIALHVYLQSLSQARARWGQDEAMIMWDNAAIRVIMGGAGNVHDLRDTSGLMGQIRGKDVLTPEEIRTLEFGRAVIVARSARPVEVQLTPWWKRSDGDEVARAKSETERLVVQYGRMAREARARRLAESVSEPAAPSRPALPAAAKPELPEPGSPGLPEPGGPGHPAPGSPEWAAPDGANVIALRRSQELRQRLPGHSRRPGRPTVRARDELSPADERTARLLGCINE